MEIMSNNLRNVIREIVKKEKNINMLWKILEEYGTEMDILEEMSKNPNIITDAGIMSEICRKGDFVVRITMVENIKDENILDTFAKDENIVVRMAVAKKTKRLETMKKLMKDELWQVRLELLHNPNIQEDILKEMVEDCDEKIKKEAKNLLSQKKEP